MNDRDIKSITRTIEIGNQQYLILDRQIRMLQAPFTSTAGPVKQVLPCPCLDKKSNPPHQLMIPGQ